MKTMRVIASTLSFVLSATPLAAQTVTTTPTTTTTTPPTTTTPTTTTPTTGTYDAMSIGNRKIARALFEAQKTETPTGGTTTGTGTTTPGTGTTSRTLTLDQIAAMKQNGQGWGQVFKTMQARGLVTGKNLGQVISQHSKQSQASRGDTTTASNRTTDSGDATTTAKDSGRGNGSVRHGGGHGRNAGSTVSARGVDYRGGGHGGSGSGSGSGHGGGNGGGHGKTK